MIVGGAEAQAWSTRVTINHLSAGRIPAGAKIERPVQSIIGGPDCIQLELGEAYFGTAQRVVQPTSVFQAPRILGGSVVPPPAQGLLWGMVVGVVFLLALCVVLARLLLARQPPAQVSPPAEGYPVGPALPQAGRPAYGSAGYGGYAQSAPVANGIGSVILGGVATGLAVGAGLAAGEALMHRVLDGGRREEVFAQPGELIGGDVLAQTQIATTWVARISESPETKLAAAGTRVAGCLLTGMTALANGVEANRPPGMTP